MTQETISLGGVTVVLTEDDDNNLDINISSANTEETTLAVTLPDNSIYEQGVNVLTYPGGPKKSDIKIPASE